MTYLAEPVSRVICDDCGWSMQADDENEACVLILIHLDVWKREKELFGTEHTLAARTAWLRETTC
jgi:hypothetical protein